MNDNGRRGILNRKLFSVLLALLISASSFAQLTGTKTIPGSYPSIAAAISALNASGVGTGGVVFNIAAGYTETFPNATSGLITTQTGSITNPVTFAKSGTGANPSITAASGKGTMDGIITIAGCDYITFDGIDLSDNPVNSGPDECFEWGYAILKASGTNGSQFVTIKNCTVSMTFYYSSSVGIYSGNHTSTSMDELMVTDQAGSNSRMKIFSNTINNSYSGIILNGYNDPNVPYDFYDQNNQVGKDGGNFITNVAGQDTDAGYGIYARCQNVLKVANNHITSAMGGSGVPYGIYLTNASNASYDLYGNYVSMQYSGAGNSAFNAIYCDMGAGGSTNTLNVYNNTVTGCTFSTLTTGTSSLIYLNNMAVTSNVYGNVVSENFIGGPDVTATGRINYLYCSMNTLVPGPFEMHDNTVIGNSRQQITTGGGFTYFMSVSGKGALLDFYNNTVTGNVVSSTSGAYLMNLAFDIGERYVYNNTVSNITGAEGVVYGMYFYNVTNNSGKAYVYKNKVTNIEGVTSGSNIYGMYTSTLGSNSYFYNNIISDLRTTAASSSSVTLAGFYDGQGVVGLYNNSIFLNNTSTGTNFNSTAVYSTSVANSLDLRNNILVNNSTPKGTGKTTVLRFNYTNLIYFAGTTNYNDLYAGIPSASRLIYYDGTNSDQTLAAYQSRVYPREMQSITEMPPFEDITATSTNLHLRTSVATQCEAGGIGISSPVAVTTDFDGEPRFPFSGYPHGTFMPNAPDIGADEFGGLSTDLTPPAITYTPLVNTMNGNARTLVVSITDGTGVPQAGTGLPVLYWKINAGSYQAVQATFVSGHTYSFVFGAGAVLGDVVSYYVVAQDLAATPNVIANPSPGATGYSANPPACSTGPATPSTYTIQLAISGVFHVGVGKNYTRLTDAAADINSKVLAGPVTLILDDNIYPSEVFPVTFNSNPGSTQANSITIKPNTGTTPYFYGSLPTGLLNLNGIDYLTIDGSNNGTGSKNITFENAVQYGGAYAILLSNNGGNDPATNITIKNCLIKCQPVNAYNGTMAIRFSANGGGYSNILIDNNIINSAFFGVLVSGSETAIARNCRITNNTIGSVNDTEAISDQGVYIGYADSTLVAGNDIMGPFSGSLNIGQTGVNITFYSTNTIIRNNRIHGFYHNADDGWGVTGIWYAAEASSVTEISNNQIYDLKAPGMNPGVGQNITYGMFFKSGGNVKILHNSISLTGPWLSSLNEASSACLGFYYQTTGMNFEVRNNILRNSQTCMGSPNVFGRAYGIMISLSAGMFSMIDNNDYFIDGYNGTIGQQYTNGIGNLVNYPTLASWQNFTGQEAASLTIDPVFASDANLLPTSGPLNNKGSYVALVPTDFTGANRNNPPDMGAYEFGSDPVVTTAAATAITGTGAVLNGTVNPSTGTVSLFFDYGTTTGYGSTVSAIPAQISGTGTYPFASTISGLTSNVLYHYRARSIAASGLISYGNDMTFTAICQAPGAAGTISGPTVTYPGQTGVAYSVLPVANAAGYSWTLPSGASIATGANTASITVDFSLSAVSGPITVYATSTCGNGAPSAPYAITVIPLNSTITGTVPGGTTNCYNAANVLTVAGGGTSFELMTGGNATFIAGQKISYLPGTTIHSGGYMHGYITANGQYCSTPSNPVVSSSVSGDDNSEPMILKQSKSIAVNAPVVSFYPNPATTSITLAISGKAAGTNTIIKITAMNGVKVTEIDMHESSGMVIPVDGLSPGMYFLHVRSGEIITILKMIKL